MSNVNMVVLIGRVGRDPEIRYSQNGGAVCNISLATTWKSKDQSGEGKEETEWSRVVLFNRLAEVVGEYVKKGSLIYIRGRLRTKKWQGQDGQDRYTTEIIADQMQMLGGRGDGGDEPQGQPTQQQRRPQQGGRNYQAPNSGMSDMDDDIPF